MNPLSYLRRAEAVRKLNPEKLLLIAVMGIGAVVIFLFGFYVHHVWWYSWFYSSMLDHEQGWELGAVVWTFFFLIYYWIKLPTNKAWHLKVAAPVVFAGVVLCALAAAIILKWIFNGAPVYHLGAVAIIGLSLVVLDLSLGLKKTALVADAPLLAGFLILIIFLATHEYCIGDNGKHENPGDLVPGAIAFELIVSNFLFFIVEWGFLDKLGPPAVTGALAPAIAPPVEPVMAGSAPSHQNQEDKERVSR